MAADLQIGETCVGSIMEEIYVGGEVDQDIGLFRPPVTFTDLFGNGVIEFGYAAARTS